MSAYHYQAIKKSGLSSKGIIEADSERQARQLLREKGLIPTQIQRLNRQKTGRQRHKISFSDLTLLTRQLATLLAAAIPIEEALKGVSEQTEKEKVRALLIGVRAKVLEGYSLAQAMDQYPQAFPELYRATVGAGEQTGRLDQVLEKLADYTENQQATRQKIQQALIYPSLMIVVSVSIISFLLTFVVPRIIDVFTGSGQELPGFTQVLISLSNGLKHYGLYLLLALIGLFILFRHSLKNQQIKMVWHRFLLRLPLISYLIRTINVSRYIHTFGILFAAGVSVLETMKIAASLINHLSICQAFDQATVKVREGSAISKALRETGFLSPMATHLISSGEKSGQIAPMMEKTALHLESEVKRLIDTGLTLLEPLIILLMGAFVLFIVLATLLPVFSMEQLLV